MEGCSRRSYLGIDKYISDEVQELYTGSTTEMISMIEVIIVAIICGYIGGKAYNNPRIRFNIEHGCWKSQKEWEEA